MDNIGAKKCRLRYPKTLSCLYADNLPDFKADLNHRLNVGRQARKKTRGLCAALQAVHTERSKKGEITCGAMLLPYTFFNPFMKCNLDLFLILHTLQYRLHLKTSLPYLCLNLA